MELELSKPRTHCSVGLCTLGSMDRSPVWLLVGVQTRSRRDAARPLFCLRAAGTPMPVLVYFAVIGSVLVALLFVADSTLEKNVSPPIVTSQRTGLPAPRYHNANAAKPPTTVPAPAHDMTSEDVLAAQPKSAPDV